MSRISGLLKKFELLLVTVSFVLIFDTILMRSLRKERQSLESIQGGTLESLLENSTLPRQVLILGYQRSGSSFLGSIFNENPDAFYMFELIDGLYSAMYGTANGWNIPTDIFNFWNGSYRHIPQDEVNAISEALNNIFHCNIQALPTEVLLHNFMKLWLSRQKRLKRFVECTTDAQKKYHVNMTACQNHIKKICPTRFGNDMRKQNLCKAFLWDIRPHPSDYNISNWDAAIAKLEHHKALFKHSSSYIVNSFKLYHQCMFKLTESISGCYPVMKKVCESSSIRSIKTVRATLDTVWHLLHQNNAVRTIHLLRDPRAISLSRLKQPSFRGAKSGQDLKKEALLFCSRAVLDVRIRRKLELKYPHSFHQVIYEDIVSAPLNKTVHIYQFIRTSLPESLRKWIIINTEEKKNSTALASSWVSSLTYDVILAINSVCKDFYEMVEYDWI